MGWQRELRSGRGFTGGLRAQGSTLAGWGDSMGAEEGWCWSLHPAGVRSWALAEARGPCEPQFPHLPKGMRKVLTSQVTRRVVEVRGVSSQACGNCVCPPLPVFLRV